MDPLSITVSIVALLQATTTVVQCLYDVKHAAKERFQLAQEITGLSLSLQQLENRLHDAQAGDSWFQGCLSLAAPEGTIAQLNQIVRELEKKLKPEDGLKKLAHKLAWPWTKQEFDRMLAQIERLKSQINFVLGQDHFQLSMEIQESGKKTNQAVRAIQDSNELDKIINMLSPLRFPAQQQQIFSEATATTGQWLLEHHDFKSWVSGNTATLYCPGRPGVGKVCLRNEADS